MKRVKIEELSMDIYLNSNSEEYIGIEHDYAPIKPPSKVNEKILVSAEKGIKNIALHTDIFKDAKITVIEIFDSEGLLGTHRSGTSTSGPIIILSEKEIINTAKEYSISLEVVTESTIYHEIGHAICELEEIVCENNYLDYSSEDDWCENFAYRFYKTKTIPEEVKKMINSERKKGTL